MPSEAPFAQTTDIAVFPAAALERLIAESEDWLMARILYYAKARHYTQYTSTLLEAWRLSISGLSASLINALSRPLDDLELSPHDDFTTDPAAAFGVTEARRHRERGVDLSMFLGLMKYYRQAYQDLISSSGFDDGARRACHRVVTLFFDRMEIGFVTTWASIADVDRIAELQEANRHMTNEKNKYLTVFESLPVAVVRINDDLIVENMNDTARRMVGKMIQSQTPYYRWAPEIDAVGDRDKRPFATFFPWLADQVTTFIRGNQPGMYFVTEMNDGNRQRHVHVRLSRMLDVSDKFKGTLVFLEDVSERVHAERALREKETFLRTILNAIQDGISVLDTDFNILQVNRSMDSWYEGEYPLIGKRCFQAYHNRQSLCEVCPSKRVLETGIHQVDEVPFETNGTEKGWLEIHAYPLKDDTGTVCGIVEYVRNITERKNGELARLESERLQGVLETAGAVGHELNQPLQSVMGQCELMFLDLSPSSPVYTRMATIRDQVYKMGEITRKLMGITRYRTKRYGKGDILDLDKASISMTTVPGPAR